MQTHRNRGVTGGDRVGRRALIAFTALAVAVVLGVLAGMVVRLGGRVKDGATSQLEPTFSATQTGFVPVDSSTTAAPAKPAKGPDVAAPGSTAPTTSAPAPSSAGVAGAPGRTGSTSSAPETSPSFTSAQTTISVQATTRTAVQVSKSSSTVSAVPAIADETCVEFGARADPEGIATLYCQHDDHDGTLRWRAVVAGGACLSRSMSGVDELGVQYRCRAAGQHLNRWVRSR
jgi:hypothetical protein